MFVLNVFYVEIFDKQTLSYESIPIFLRLLYDVCAKRTYLTGGRTI